MILKKIIYSLIWNIGDDVFMDGFPRANSVGGLVTIGGGVRIGRDVQIDCAKGAELIIGNGVSIGDGTFIVARASIKIGEYSIIGERVSIRDNDHGWTRRDIPIYRQGFISLPVIIEDRVQIGDNVAINKGVQLGSGSTVDANAVVTRSFPSATKLGGAPARPLVELCRGSE